MIRNASSSVIVSKDINAVKDNVEHFVIELDVGLNTLDISDTVALNLDDVFEYRILVENEAGNVKTMSAAGSMGETKATNYVFGSENIPASAAYATYTCSHESSITLSENYILVRKN